MSVWKKIGKFAKDWIKNPLSPITKPIEMGLDYAKDFKNWYDGTDAQRKANRMNRENWELQNQYNTPEAQMARYVAAGLNPNLIYSQSNEAGSIASVQPTMSGGDQLSKLASAVMNVLSMKNMVLQNSMLSTQKSYLDEQVDRYAWDTKWLKEHNLSTFSPAIQRNFGVGFDYLKGPLEWLANLLGTGAGYLESAGNGNSIVLKADRFDSKESLNNAFHQLSEQGYSVKVRW